MSLYWSLLDSLLEQDDGMSGWDSTQPSNLGVMERSRQRDNYLYEIILREQPLDSNSSTPIASTDGISEDFISTANFAKYADPTDLAIGGLMSDGITITMIQRPLQRSFLFFVILGSPVDTGSVGISLDPFGAGDWPLTPPEDAGYPLVSFAMTTPENVTNAGANVHARIEWRQNTPSGPQVPTLILSWTNFGFVVTGNDFNFQVGILWWKE